MPDITLTSAPVTWQVANLIEGSKARGANGYVEFEASAVAVHHGSLMWLPSPQRAEVVDGTMAPLDLPINDPDVWNWKVTPRLGVNWTPFHINVEEGGTNLAHAAIVPGKGPVKVLQGPPGASIVDFRDLGDGRLVLVLSDGTESQPVPFATGPQGPANELEIGTVLRGDEPYASLVGEAPHQVLNLVLPKGDPGNPEDLVDATTEQRGLMSAADKIRMESPGVYAVDYGAVGDGVTDDSAALNAAAADAEGRTLHLTAGAVYSISAGVYLSDGITLEGHGATLVKPDDAADSLALVKATPQGATGYGSGGGNITIRDLTICGSYNSSSGQGDCTSYFHHVSGLTIERCTFRQGLLVGHYLDLAGCENVTVRGCVFEGANPIPGREYSEAVQMDASTYAGSSDKANDSRDTYDGLPSRGVTISGCDFRPLVVAGIEYPMPCPFGNHGNARVGEDGYYTDIAFTDNLVRGWTRDTVHYWAGWITLAGVRGGIIARNRFTYTGNAGANSRGVIVLRRATSAIPLAQVAESSPSQEDIDRPCHGVTIADNVFTGFDTYWSSDGGAGWGLLGIHGAGAPSDIAFTGNRVNGCNGEAIRLSGGRAFPVIVASNTVTSRSAITTAQTSTIIQGNSFVGGQTPTVGIATSGMGAPVQIASNMVKGFPTGITVASADNGLVQGNFVDYYTATGIRIGQASGDVAYDVTVSGNRVRSPERTDSTVALHIATTARRAMRFGNRVREGGDIVDEGPGTITAATDQTS